MEPELEYRFAEAEAVSAGTIEGRVMRYGEEADIGGMFREKVLPGAFRMGDVIVNLHHDSKRPIARTDAGLGFVDSKLELRAQVQPAGTQDGAEALALVRSRILRGFSVEMRVQKEDWINGVRVIREADLLGIAIVARPAYSQATVDIAKRAEARVIRAMHRRYAV